MCCLYSFSRSTKFIINESASLHDACFLVFVYLWYSLLQHRTTVGGCKVAFATLGRMSWFRYSCYFIEIHQTQTKIMNAFRKHELCAASTTIADGGAEMCEKRETVSVVMMDALYDVVYVCKQRTRQLELLEAERVHQRIRIQKLMQRCCARCCLGCSKFLALLRMQRECTFPPLHSVWLCDVLREVAILEWPNICAMRTGIICTRLFVFVV